ncbi:helix-turn-helix transcriptional regulator [Variovorax ureilyticus]|uniref:Helix-turn-helix transcriptional regulator n=1 Tax=Variovorax ureilyticus TaxID=1836198 RepID=A0ABU8VRI9_9BURK
MPHSAEAPNQIAPALLEKLAANVLALREAGNWSTRALAEHCRIDRRTLQRMEHRELGTLSLDTVDRLAKGLGVDTGSLLGAKPVARRESDRVVQEIIGTSLVSARDELQWTQYDLSAHSGVSRTLIAHIERGARNPSLKTLGRLADALDTTVEKLLSDPRGPS